MNESRLDLVEPGRRRATPLIVVEQVGYQAWLAAAPDATRQWLADTGFSGEADAFAFLPAGAAGRPAVLGIVASQDSPWALSGLATALPHGRYELASPTSPAQATAAASSWALARYRFDRYRSPPSEAVELAWPPGADRIEVGRLARAVFLARDLINTPAEDMGPGDLTAAAQAVADEAGASLSVIAGDDLLIQGYPTIHAVGRASTRAPRLIDLRWGAEGAPRLTLVGKGVCFDTGGLDLKSRDGMRAMKVDMGGAAVVLALGQALMAAKAPVRLRVLIPAVDNAVSGDAIRPGDVVRTRAGNTVEIGDTDAEGRLILCDALAEADSEAPDLLIDCATLTGAARIALGTELQALYCRDDALADSLVAASAAVDDPLWRMPLWRPYRKLMEGKISDLTNIADTPFGGSVTAAIFLADFVRDATSWIHLDIFAGNAKSRPGRPEGGEATGLRALYSFLRARYG